MTQHQWWVALAIAGTLVLMEFYDRAKPAYDSWKNTSVQSPAKRK